MNSNFWWYLLVMALVTYLVRLIPMLLVKNEIKNEFILSFLHYIPYSVLAVMTVPAVFYCTSSIWSAVFGVMVACVLAFRGKGLFPVALGACLGVLLCECVITFI